MNEVEYCSCCGQELPKNDFAERVTQFRKNKKLSQRELAQAVGVEQAAISKIERRYHRPTIDVVVRIAAALDVSCDELLIDPKPAQVESDDLSD